MRQNGSKMSIGQSAISRQPMETFLPKFQDLQRKEFSTVLENFTEIFSLLQELQLLQYFVPYFKTTPKKCTVTCCVQCSKWLSSFFLNTRSKCPSYLSHKLDVFLWTSVRPCWFSPAAAGPILTARLSSVHQCSLAWDEMSCSVHTKSSEVMIKRVNVRRVWWPFVFANTFAAVGGNPLLSKLCCVSRRTVLPENETRR